MTPVRIMIFAKAPLPGLAKTRLIPSLGAEGSAQLARRMLHHTIDEALRADVGIVELCVAPDLEDPIWTKLALPASLILSTQGEGDLGMRLARASQRVTDNGEAILLIGTDCPGLTANVLRQAAGALDDHESCLVPVSDGGYALLGLRKYLASVFSDISWSTSQVADQTREKIQNEGWMLREFSTLNDVDEPEDLHWLPSYWPEYVTHKN